MRHEPKDRQKSDTFSFRQRRKEVWEVQVSNTLIQGRLNWGAVNLLCHFV